jgi:tetratricopeptide (TPR) repeat protein
MLIRLSNSGNVAFLNEPLVKRREHAGGLTFSESIACPYGYIIYILNATSSVSDGKITPGSMKAISSLVAWWTDIVLRYFRYDAYEYPEPFETAYKKIQLHLNKPLSHFLLELWHRFDIDISLEDRQLYLADAIGFEPDTSRQIAVLAERICGPEHEFISELKRVVDSGERPRRAILHSSLRSLPPEQIKQIIEMFTEGIAENLLPLDNDENFRKLSQKFVEKAPQDIAARRLLAVAELHCGDTVKALATLEEAISLTTMDAQLYVDRALLFHASGDTQKAQADLISAMILDDEHAPAHLAFAELLTDSGQAYKAIDHYQKTLTLAPRFPRAWLAIAKLNLENDQLDNAKNCLERTLILDPWCSEAKQLIKQLSTTLDGGTPASHSGAEK